MKSIRIRWETTQGNLSHNVYFVNDSPVGEDQIGFDKILDLIKINKEADVILQIRQISSLGGNNIVDTLPFKDRFAELKKALGSRSLTYEFF